MFDEGAGISTATQQYDPTPIIDELRRRIDQWRAITNPSAWGVTPETARLLEHWRHHEFTGVRPFFCQIEAVETVIYAFGPLRPGRASMSMSNARCITSAAALRPWRRERRRQRDLR